MFQPGKVSELLVTVICSPFPQVTQVHPSQTYKRTTERKAAEQNILLMLKHAPLYHPTCENAPTNDSI